MKIKFLVPIILLFSYSLLAQDSTSVILKKAFKLASESVKPLFLNCRYEKTLPPSIPNTDWDRILKFNRKNDTKKNANLTFI